MSKPIYRENGIEVYEDGLILLIKCPRCARENWALEVASGFCAWCGYNAHEDEELRERINQNE